MECILEEFMGPVEAFVAMAAEEVTGRSGLRGGTGSLV